MSPQGCLSTVFIGLILLWSLFIGGFMAAGWLGAEILEFFARLLLADADGARRSSESIMQFMRTLGFGVFTAVWAVGTGTLALLWFMARRGARSVADGQVDSMIDIEIRSFPAPEEMKDVTPRNGDRGRPPEILPPR